MSIKTHVAHFGASDGFEDHRTVFGVAVRVCGGRAGEIGRFDDVAHLCPRVEREQEAENEGNQQTLLQQAHAPSFASGTHGRSRHFAAPVACLLVHCYDRTGGACLCARSP